VKQDLLDELFGRDAEFDDEILLRGLNHRNTSVRRTVVKLLRKRRTLAASVAEPLLNDGDAEVRYEAMQALIAIGRSYSVEQARAVLVRKSPNATGLGLFALSQTDTEGEAVLAQYTRQFFDSLTVERRSSIRTPTSL
jgi:HEAT repeat protein